jgi:hypothetical protein
MGGSQGQLSIWRLRYDVVSTRALVGLFGGLSRDDLNPAVHVFLADRYGRLALCASHRGARRRADRLSRKAAWHSARGGFDDFPRAAAMAMPVPRPRLFVDARAKRAGHHVSDDAA